MSEVALGAGLYETVRSDDGLIRFGRRHLARMTASASVFGLPVPAEAQFVRAVRDGLEGGPVVRVTLYRGEAGDALLAGEGRAIDGTDPVQVTTLTGWYAPGYLLREHKLTSHFHGVWARRQARELGFDDALLVARDGAVGESSNGNVVIVESGALVTPPIDGLLPGVMRDALIRVASTNGIAVHERRLTLAQVRTSDGALLTSAPRGPYEISRIDGTPLRRVAPALLAILREGVEDLARAGSLAL